MSDSTDRPTDGPIDPTAPPEDAGWPASEATAPAYGESTGPSQQPAYGQQPEYPPTAYPQPEAYPPPAAYGPPPTYPPPAAYGQQPASGQPPTYPPSAAYGQPPAYGQYPAYGQPQPGYGQGPYGPPAPSNGSAMVLTVLSGIGTVSCCLFLAPALIFGIVALTKQSNDPAGSAKVTRYGWIAFGVAMVLAVLAVVAFFGFGAAGFFDDGGSYEYEYDDSF